MRYLKVLPRLLLDLPALARFLLILLCTIVCQTIFIVLIPAAQNPTVLAVPIAVSAWIYRRRGALLCLAGITVSTWIFYALRVHNIWLRQDLLMDFLIGDVCLVIVAQLISSQRDSFERAAESERQMARAYEREQRLNKAKDSFIQQMNHELRTPLTALSGYLELLQEGGTQIDTETRAGFLQSALLSCEELQLLVENILDSLQVGSDPDGPPLQEIDLAEFIEETIQQSDPRWNLEQRVHLELPRDIRVLAHKQYLRQVLRNLLSNAIKYTPQQLPILIAARKCDSSHLSDSSPLPEPPASSTSRETRISIQDFGPGIPPAEITRIFEPFTRLQRDALGQVRGSGLGLSISKQLIEAMGGQIWVESSGQTGKGSRFTFTLPTKPEQTPGSPSQSPAQITRASLAAAQPR